MASLCKVILIGHLGGDPETRYLPSGDAVTSISIATSEKWTDKASGDAKEHTEWHSVTFFGKLAEIAGEYLKKGSQCYVEGRIRTDKWQDKETGQDRYRTKIVADKMLMLGSKGERSGGAQDYREASGGSKKSEPQKKGGFDTLEDDIPF